LIIGYMQGNLKSITMLKLLQMIRINDKNFIY